MFSSDKNIETIADIVEALKAYIELQKEYLQLNMVEKVIRLLTVTILALVFLFITLIITVFVTLALATVIKEYFSDTISFLIVAGIYVLILFIILLCRKPLIERPLVRILARILTE